MALTTPQDLAETVYIDGISRFDHPSEDFG